VKINDPWLKPEESKNYSTLGFYIFSIADFEARQVGSTECQPCHLFLGILKVVDVDITTMDFTSLTLAQRDPILVSMLKEANVLREIYERAKIDARKLRKEYREKIRVSDAPTVTDGTMLTPSKSLNECFLEAESISKGSRVRTFHMLNALLQRKATVRDELLTKIGSSKASFLNSIELETAAKLS
jgi:hypothetical protein